MTAWLTRRYAASYARPFEMWPSAVCWVRITFIFHSTPAIRASIFLSHYAHLDAVDAQLREPADVTRARMQAARERYLNGHTPDAAAAALVSLYRRLVPT